LAISYARKHEAQYPPCIRENKTECCIALAKNPDYLGGIREAPELVRRVPVFKTGCLGAEPSGVTTLKSPDVVRKIQLPLFTEICTSLYSVQADRGQTWPSV